MTVSDELLAAWQDWDVRSAAITEAGDKALREHGSATRGLRVSARTLEREADRLVAADRVYAATIGMEPQQLRRRFAELRRDGHDYDECLRIVEG